jgi:molybdenum cofactor cytidylyltransferase
LNGDTTIGYLQRKLARTQLNEIIIVLGAQADKIKPYLLNHKKIKFVYNKDYILGQTSSFKVGLGLTSNNTSGIMLLPVDCPFIQKETIDRLIQTFLNKDPLILIPAYHGKKGHPPLFSARLRGALLGLNNDRGLNTVAQSHQGETVIFPVEDRGVITSFNTPEEFDDVQRLFKDNH